MPRRFERPLQRSELLLHLRWRRRLTPNLETPNPNPKPRTRNPETRTPKPETRTPNPDPEPQTPNFKHGFLQVDGARGRGVRFGIKLDHLVARREGAF